MYPVPKANTILFLIFVFLVFRFFLILLFLRMNAQVRKKSGVGRHWHENFNVRPLTTKFFCGVNEFRFGVSASGITNILRSTKIFVNAEVFRLPLDDNKGSSYTKTASGKMLDT